MANVKGTGSTAHGRSQKGKASGIPGKVAQTGRASGATPSPGRSKASLKPPTHSLPMNSGTNMQKPGSDNESHHPNGVHKATNPKMGPC